MKKGSFGKWSTLVLWRWYEDINTLKWSSCDVVYCRRLVDLKEPLFCSRYVFYPSEANNSFPAQLQISTHPWREQVTQHWVHVSFARKMNFLVKPKAWRLLSQKWYSSCLPYVPFPSLLYCSKFVLLPSFFSTLALYGYPSGLLEL